MGIKSRTFDIPSTAGAANGVVPGDKSYRVKLTEKEKKRVETLIRNAKSLQEITRLEKVRTSRDSSLPFSRSSDPWSLGSVSETNGRAGLSKDFNGLLMFTSWNK